MRTVTRIHVAICSMMLACTGTLSVPLAAHAEGDAAAGEKIFAHCAPCHSTKPGENKFGPSLAGVFDRKSGTEPGYSYSSAVKGLNVTWDGTNLNEWLQGPSEFAKGTKMIYSVPDEKDRQDVIAYLKTLTDCGVGVAPRWTRFALNSLGRCFQSLDPRQPLQESA
jgi:cytochrome c